MKRIGSVHAPLSLAVRDMVKSTTSEVGSEGEVLTVFLPPESERSIVRVTKTIVTPTAEIAQFSLAHFFHRMTAPRGLWFAMEPLVMGSTSVLELRPPLWSVRLLRKTKEEEEKRG